MSERKKMCLKSCIWISTGLLINCLGDWYNPTLMLGISFYTTTAICTIFLFLLYLHATAWTVSCISLTLWSHDAEVGTKCAQMLQFALWWHRNKCYVWQRHKGKLYCGWACAHLRTQSMINRHVQYLLFP